jgi:putative ATPase
VANTIAEPVPLHLRNAVTGLMANFGYGKGYEYAHDAPERLTRMTCLPGSLKDRRYYHPTGEGFEKQLRDRIEAIGKWKQNGEPEAGS